MTGKRCRLRAAAQRRGPAEEEEVRHSRGLLRIRQLPGWMLQDQPAVVLFLILLVTVDLGCSHRWKEVFLVQVLSFVKR